MMNTGTILKRRLLEKSNSWPEPGSDKEKRMFEENQKLMFHQYEKIFPDICAPKTIVINPSLTLDLEILSKLKGAVHYEERLLSLLMLLRMPATKVIYLSSMPFPDVTIDYYLHLLQGITGKHARERLTMLSCHDLSYRPLTEKILERPRMIEKIRSLITDPSSTHLTCYNITPLEKTLAVRLGIPLFGTDPGKFYEGSKSGGRKTFRESGIDLPDGSEDLKSKEEIAQALAELRRRKPGIRKAVVKMNDGFSGEGNAMYRYPEIKDDSNAEKIIFDTMDENLKMIAVGMSHELFYRKFEEMEGIVEEFLEGEIKVSPSVQCVIGSSSSISIESTHDQLLGGEDGQTYLGAEFPADAAYAKDLAVLGRKVANTLAAKGVLGRFAVDFISVKEKDGKWKHYAIEINLRKGGTTHPYMMMKFLTDGNYRGDEGDYITASGNKRYYFASDNLIDPRYKGLTPSDLIDIAMFHGLMYDGAAQEGVVFHLIGALSEFGKLGVVCIGKSPAGAKDWYNKTIEVLNYECGSK